MSWNLVQALAFTSTLKEAVVSAELNLYIIGSVATHGTSQKDLDLLVVPKVEEHGYETFREVLSQSVEDILDASDDETEIEQCKLKDGRIVDVFFR